MQHELEKQVKKKRLMSHGMKKVVVLQACRSFTYLFERNEQKKYVMWVFFPIDKRNVTFDDW